MNHEHDFALIASYAGITLTPGELSFFARATATTGDGRWASFKIAGASPTQILIRELAGLFLHGERILHVAHDMRSARRDFEQMRRIILAAPQLMRHVRRISSHGEARIDLTPPGGWIRFTSSPRPGWKADLVAADKLTPALLMSLHSSPNPQIWTATWGVNTDPDMELVPSGQPDLFWRIIRRRG